MGVSDIMVLLGSFNPVLSRSSVYSKGYCWLSLLAC